MTTEDFDLIDTNSEEMRNAGLVPEGKYPAIVVKAETLKTRGERKFARLHWKISEGPQANRVVWDDHFVYDGEPEKKAICQAKLSKAVKAVGLTTCKNASELVGRKAIIAVSIQQSEVYDPSNRIKKYESYGPTAAPPMSQPVSGASVW
jgi:hypothetical protein